uniref:Uncharacterized protein n=1 Tax=Stomoxys calcitrans TaxID=35570 RepID=A0A1I8P7I5_STOCA
MAAPSAKGLESLQQPHHSQQHSHHNQQHETTQNLQQQQQHLHHHHLQHHQHQLFHHPAATASCSSANLPAAAAAPPPVTAAPSRAPPSHAHHLHQHSEHPDQCCNCYLPVLQPDVLLNNDRGLFKVYCFIKDFIGSLGPVFPRYITSSLLPYRCTDTIAATNYLVTCNFASHYHL